MTNLAANHLRQARLCAAEGDTSRAVELLEQARVLAGGDAQLKQDIFSLLAELYDLTGRHNEAEQCRAELPRSRNPPPPIAQRKGSTPAPLPAKPPKPTTSSPPHRNLPLILYGAIAATVILSMVIGAVVFWIAHQQRENNDQVAAHRSPADLPKRSLQPATVPTTTPLVTTAPIVLTTLSPMTAPTTPPIASTTTAPLVLTSIFPTTKSTTHPSIFDPPISIAEIEPPAATKPVVTPATLPSPRVASKIDRQDLMNEAVGLCVEVARYEGTIPGVGKVQIDLPVGTGTAFSVTTGGVMLTNKHVIEGVKDTVVPITLDKFHLRGFTRREVFYIVCFGADPRNRFPARILYKSKPHDLAVLKIDRKVEHPLVLSKSVLRQGADILVCGYPGVVMEALNDSAETPAKMKELAKKWETTRHIDAFDGFSPDAFGSTLTKGIISAPSRTVDGAAYVQIDAGISPGNSGGPVLNADNEVIGIATWALRSTDKTTSASYNFALSIGQLMEELRPYLKD